MTIASHLSSVELSGNSTNFFGEFPEFHEGKCKLLAAT